MGRKLKYVSEDSGFKLDQGVAIFKKIMAAEKPNFFYGDSTQLGEGDHAGRGRRRHHVMTSSTSLASVVADPVNVPQHIVPGPTYPSAARDPDGVHRQATWKGAEKPRIAYVYSESEFGHETASLAAKARAPKSSVCRSSSRNRDQTVGHRRDAPEVAKLRRSRKPNIVMFQGYIAGAHARVRAPDERGGPWTSQVYGHGLGPGQAGVRRASASSASTPRRA